MLALSTATFAAALAPLAAAPAPLGNPNHIRALANCLATVAPHTTNTLHRTLTRIRPQAVCLAERLLDKRHNAHLFY